MRTAIILVLAALLVCPPVQSATDKDSSQGYTPKDFDNGFQVALEIMKELKIEEDPAKIKRVNEIGYRVAQRAAPEMPNFSFRIVKMEEPNAFALPGGFIFVTTGMLDLDLNDDELAALLGHEIIHVKNEHSRKMSKRQTLMNLLYQALIIGIAVGLKDSTSYDPVTGQQTRSSKAEVLQGSAAFGLVFQELLLRGFNRELELESDHEGMIASTRAGFSAKGTNQLFDKMRQRIYEAPGYGYWRTHPYLEDRSEQARTLSVQFEPAKNPASAEDFRRKTQDIFLSLMERKKEEEEKRELRRMALDAYPTGKEADELRWWFIRDAETRESQKEPFFRDYGKLIRLYEENIAEVNQEKSVLPAGIHASVTIQVRGEDSTELLEKLEKNLAQLRIDLDATKPMYEEVLEKKLFDTEMLQRFISNFPDSPRVPEVQYRLGENYRILKKGADAVDLYLTSMKASGDNEWKAKSRESLLQMIPSLKDLSSCYKIQADADDEALKNASADRMKVLAQSFDSLQNGYEFRRNYPTSNFEEPVRTQMTKLASDTLHQAKLYQALGQFQKALDHYNQILRYCSDLPVADQVKDSIVDFQELSAVKG